MEHRQGIARIEDLAKYFKRQPQSITKAVLKGQLPPPVLVSDVKCWTWESILEHIRKRELEAKRKREAVPHVVELRRPGQQHNNS